MKKPNWKVIFPPHTHIKVFGPPIQPGRIGHAFCDDITVHLQITEMESDTLFHAVVTGFSPPTAKLPDLEVTDKVVVCVQHFIPD